ncbi:hypothetical protein A4A49_19934 [Nicotiana attenuata]|uniref:Uncharacterized protein n=1 Tax=Nicotiana attenuata TaxID=49451 RepID=A0A1J6I9H8_NICAT|nr:hypothetical protein A4A49_19934 [Nicotiana attenuata]
MASKYFILRWKIGGMMVSEVGPVYFGGRTEHVFNVDEDHLSNLELADYDRSFGITKLGNTFVVPSNGGNLVELKNDRKIYGLSLLLSDRDTIDIYVGEYSIIEEGGPTGLSFSQITSIDANLSTVDVNEDEYSSIDWTYTDEEEAAQDLAIVEHTAQNLAIVQQSAGREVDSENDIVGNDGHGAESDQSVDYESDVHEELRIVKQDVKQFKKQNRRAKKDASKGISSWYMKEIYLKAYSHFIQPVPCMEMWPETDNPKVEPPLVVKMPGRPKKNRKKEAGEIKRAGKLSKKGITMTCSICKEANHNKRGCPKNPNPKIKDKATPEFDESQQSSTVNPKKRNRGDSDTSSKGLPSSRTLETPSATVINSAHVTGDIGYQPTKGLKCKGKTAITQR